MYIGETGRGDKVADEVVDMVADETATAVAMVVLRASRPLAHQTPEAMMLRCQASKRNFAARIKDALTPDFTTHLRASIKIKLFSIANTSARRPPVLPPVFSPSPAINLATCLLPFVIFVCLILIPPTPAIPAFPDTSTPPPSSSFRSGFAPASATCYVTINCKPAPYSIAAPQTKTNCQ